MQSVKTRNLFGAVTRWITGYSLRHRSTKNPATKNNFVVTSKEANLIACWHPEAEFPYDHTLPIPRDELDARLADSKLKIQHLKDYEARDKRHGPTMYELAKMFSEKELVFRHRPALRKNSYKRKQKPPPEREGL